MHIDWLALQVANFWLGACGSIVQRIPPETVPLRLPMRVSCVDDDAHKSLP